MNVAGSRHKSGIKHVHCKKGAFLRQTERSAVAVQPYWSPALMLTSLSMCLYEAWLQNGSSSSSFFQALQNTPFIVLPGALPEASRGGGLFGHSDIWTGGSIPMCLKSVCRLASDQGGISFSKQLAAYAQISL